MLSKRRVKKQLQKSKKLGKKRIGCSVKNFRTFTVTAKRTKPAQEQCEKVN